MPTLETLQTGQIAVIQSIENHEVALQALRIGLGQGERVQCLTKIPAGPIVLQKGGMELAIGRELAQQIRIEVLP